MKNSNNEGRNRNEYNFIFNDLIALTYIVSRYLYLVALIVPSKIDILFNPIEKVIYRLINTKLEHMSGKTYLKHFFGSTE